MTQISGFSRRSFLRSLGRSAAAGVFVRNRSQLVPIAALPGSPSPKFWFGQRVQINWVNDDNCDLQNFGKLYWMRGLIVGVVFNHPDFLRATGWFYYIHLDESCQWIEHISEVESFPESEVTLVETLEAVI